MHSKLFSLAIVAMLFLFVVPVMADTEDEIVARFLKKNEKKHQAKVGFFELNGSYGRFSRANEYNYFAGRVTPLITSLNGTDGQVDYINSTKELNAGFGFMTSQKTSMTLGLNYWFKMGSTQSGDFNLSLVNAADPVQTDFALKSEVKVYGVAGEFGYFLTNPPDNDGVLRKIAFKLSAGAGYYRANWELWQGVAGLNLDSQAEEPIDGTLTGGAPGGSLGLSAEYPLSVGGLVLSGTAKYLYLNFTNMRWYNNNNSQVVATYNASGGRVDLNFSGPRAQIGLKKYLSW